jgi:hypothetical protein
MAKDEESGGMPDRFRDIVNRLEAAMQQAHAHSKVLIALEEGMTEEEFVQILADLDTKELGLDYFDTLATRLLEDESYLLLKILKTHIEYNFDVELLINDEGYPIKYNEISKKS